jgi:signal transduction histidine kinase
MSTTHQPASPDAVTGSTSTSTGSGAGGFDAPNLDRVDDLTRDALQVIAEGITALAGFGVAAISVARDADTLQVMAVAGDDEARETLLGTLTPTAHLMSELADAEDWGLFRFVPAETLDPAEEAWGWVPDMTPLEVDDAWDPMDLLVAPLFDEHGQIRGILSIDVPDDGRRPDQARRAILNEYAAQVGRALQVAIEREKLAEQVRMANAAREVVRHASRDLEIGTLLRKVQPAVVTGFRASGMWLHTFDEDGHGQGAVYTADGGSLTMPAELVSIAGRAATDSWEAQRVGIVSRTRIVGSEVSDAEVEQILEFLQAIGVGSILFVPMGAGEECLGSLVLTRDLGRPDWSDIEMEVALDVGRDLGRIVFNSRAFQRERELVRELQALDRYKGQLIATLSHELKSPLTAILANVELARQVDLDPEISNVLEAVDRGAVRLVRVVENLLLLARVGDPDMPLLPEPVDLRELLEDLLGLTSAEAGRRGVDVVLDSPEPVVGLGDRAELDLVLTNLLSNAMKYTQPGGRIVVTLSRLHDEVLFTCHDEGIGISPEDQGMLFQEFFRSNSPAVKAEPGTGLGLTIVQRIVARHHGRIEVESELGLGSTFRVYLPAA